MQIKHIFFDLDHTLWDFEINSSNTFKHILSKNKVELDFERFMGVYSPINHRYWKLYREDKVSKVDLRYGRLKETFDSLNYNASDKLIDLLAEEYIHFLPDHNKLFDGAIEILEYLKPKYNMHIITNGFEEVQHKKMESSNILTYFDKVITSEEVGVKKPNPKIFNYALEKSKANSHESIMIGDNFEADILGAKNVGMHTIFCEFNGEVATGEVLTITKLIQLKQFL